MTTKLTLTLDNRIIEQAKKLAKSQQRSLSNLVEEYLKSVIEPETSTADIPLTPIVKSLKGSVPVEAPESFDAKAILEEELVKKYLG